MKMTIECVADKDGKGRCYVTEVYSDNSYGNSGGGNSNNQKGTGGGYPSGSDRDNSYGNSGGSGNNGSSGSSSVINVGIGYDYAPGKHAYNISFNSIIKQISNPQHGYLVPEKTINLRNNNLSDSDIGVLAGNLQYQRLDLDVFDVSNNKIGFGGVENLFYGLRFDNTLAGRYILTMNFSNNLIDDNGAKYMADSLAMGRFPNLKSLDVSSNQITSTGYGHFLQALESPKTQDVAITLSCFSALKSAYEFVAKGLKYAIEQHAKRNVDNFPVVTDNPCKDLAKDLGMGTLAGVIKCSSILKDTNPVGAFICVTTTGDILEILLSETSFKCIAEVNALFDDYTDNYKNVVASGQSSDNCCIQ